MFRSVAIGGTLGSIGLAGLLWVTGCAPISEPGATAGEQRSNGKEAKAAAAIADAEASAKTRDESEQRMKTAQRLLKGNAISVEDFRGAQLTWDRYFLETISKEKAITSAKSELNQAATILQMHEC